MSVFFEVAKTVDQSEPFAVIRIDTAKKVGAGVEGVVVSTHRTQEDADNARMDAVTMVERRLREREAQALIAARDEVEATLSEIDKAAVELEEANTNAAA